jgi:hypothetical protein
VYITTIANRNSPWNSPPAVLLRESYREQGKVKSRTLANLSRWPEAKIDALRRVLADEPMQPASAQRFEIERALAYGHVAAALGTLRRIGLEQIRTSGQADDSHDRPPRDRTGRQACHRSAAQRRHGISRARRFARSR